MDYALIESNLDKLRMKLERLGDCMVIVSGGAKGSDAFAEAYASSRCVPLVIFYPDYTKFGKGATFKRNSNIVGASDMIVAFWDEKSKGTIDTMVKGWNKKIEVWVINPQGRHYRFNPSILNEQFA